MSTSVALLAILIVGAVGFFTSSTRAISQRQPGIVSHSLPAYHGWLTVLLAILPAIAVLIAWTLVSDLLIEQNIRAGVAAGANPDLIVGIIKSAARALETLGLSGDTLPKSYADLTSLASGINHSLPDNGENYMVTLADAANQQRNLAQMIGGAIVIVMALIGAGYGLSRVAPRARARNQVEQVMLWGLVAASTIAILTTIGIVFSMLGETLRFFSEVNPLGFFFGTVWDPRFAAAGAEASEGQFGLIPLLAGTLYIALVSMLVAVPVGLMAAIYMGEYASPRVRSTVKPLLELLAGIPTIVYGIFAVVTLGPFLRDISAALAGGNAFIQAQSVFTAGLIMGVMLIPVVSSLSDDVITAVPRAMRDGSLAIGATRSETIKKVILPAALPGIVGALLLTASRAIGETMIVVLAAGVAARLSINPFEAMTTITVKIVNQLTGDLEFDSPQTLVAFALGLTLFVVTLGMNVYALYIVRKYREQYE
ncbi:MAG: phosphate ABC transporter permease subunit PstC [Devosia sp.]